jgi:hypothetical protein
MQVRSEVNAPTHCASCTSALYNESFWLTEEMLLAVSLFLEELAESFAIEPGKDRIADKQKRQNIQTPGYSDPPSEKQQTNNRRYNNKVDHDCRDTAKAHREIPTHLLRLLHIRRETAFGISIPTRP